MGNPLNLIGDRFNRLLVVGITNKRDKCGRIFWKCLCDCGNKVNVVSSQLKNSHSQSCGCLNRELVSKNSFKDLTGMEFGYLKVLEFSGNNASGKSTFLCKCTCGNIKKISSNALTTGATVSCGCYHSKVMSENRGEKSYRWRGGWSAKDYPPEWNSSLKEFIRNRDDRKCQYPECNYDDTKEKQRLSVHHIDGNKKNCSETNLISLCNRHHLIVEGKNPKLWVDRFYMYTESFCV